MSEEEEEPTKVALEEIEAAITKFSTLLKPFNVPQKVSLFTDYRTDAKYAEFHVQACKLVEYGTTDFPLDVEEQAEYRANRELVNAPAFDKMQEDARMGRTFSNIVCEFTEELEPERPLKIIGGQHRFQAIQKALGDGVDVWHGVKVYFGLNTAQRLDVQLISNTSIAISPDLLDRMQETEHGPALRNWCQSVGLLMSGQDFADKRVRGGPISVQVAKTFILNYFAGMQIDDQKFDTSATLPLLCQSGQASAEWEELRKSNPKYYEDNGLTRAGKEFVRLVAAQRSAFSGKKVKPDRPEKAMNLAIMAAWAFVAGALHKNEPRLKRHYAIADRAGGDPLNVAVLVHATHKTDPENYRGLGYRTDAKERGRMAELFWLQAEDGQNYNKARVELAVSKHFAKEAMLDVKRKEAMAAEKGGA